MKPCNIIFLDIDGVMNTENCQYRHKLLTGSTKNEYWSPIACRHLTQLCEQFDARIIFSSTWRTDKDEEELRKILAKNDINPDLLIGITPDLEQEALAEKFCRGDEIKCWLDENSCRNYVIIDDLPPSDFLEIHRRHLVTVKPDTGFASKKAAEKAGEILSGNL